MNDNAQPLSPNKQALLKIRQLKQQLAAAQDCTGEPIAIVSMACRFPNASDTPEKFWQSLIQQQELVGEIPDARWDLERFDAEVRKSQAKRWVVYESLRNGAYYPWDYQPLQKASDRFMRNHMDLNVVEENARYPRGE